MIKKIILILLLSYFSLITGLRSEIKAYFNGQCEAALIESINKAKVSIDIAIFTFTRFAIARSLLAAHKRGVKVRIIIDAKQAEGEYADKILRLLKNASIEPLLLQKEDRVHMHHKFCVIDQSMTITGSYNYTTTASKKNSENLVIIENKKIAKEFNLEWLRLKKAALEQ